VLWSSWLPLRFLYSWSWQRYLDDLKKLTDKSGYLSTLIFLISILIH
jgi:hypothetical protein